jgi:hypothetical protein
LLRRLGHDLRHADAHVPMRGAVTDAKTRSDLLETAALPSEFERLCATLSEGDHRR